VLALAFACTTALGPGPVPAEDVPTARFVAENRSPYAIHAVYACPPRSATWGANLIEGRTLAPGRRLAVELRGGCGVYDLRFVAEDGIEFLEDEVPFCADDTEAAAAAAGSVPQDGDEDAVTLGRNDLVKTRRAPGGPSEGEGGRER
jgi:hypothetical protein